MNSKDNMSRIPNGQNGKQFEHFELLAALHDFEDLMLRMVCPFLVLKQTAKACREMADLTGDRIEAGIQNEQMTKEVIESIKVYKPDSVWTEKGFHYELDGILVDVKIIKRNYKFFEYPEHRVYQYGDYLLPNPFEEYWKARFLIQ